MELTFTGRGAMLYPSEGNTSGIERVVKGQVLPQFAATQSNPLCSNAYQIKLEQS